MNRPPVYWSKVEKGRRPCLNTVSSLMGTLCVHFLTPILVGFVHLNAPAQQIVLWMLAYPIMSIRKLRFVDRTLLIAHLLLN